MRLSRLWSVGLVAALTACGSAQPGVDPTAPEPDLAPASLLVPLRPTPPVDGLTGRAVYVDDVLAPFPLGGAAVLAVPGARYADLLVTAGLADETDLAYADFPLDDAVATALGGVWTVADDDGVFHLAVMGDTVLCLAESEAAGAGSVVGCVRVTVPQRAAVVLTTGEPGVRADLVDLDVPEPAAPSEPGPGVPQVEIGAATSDEPGTVTFHWTSSDPDGDPLRHDVLVSGDGGETWSMIGYQLPGSAMDAPHWALPDGGPVTLRVVATDGRTRVEVTSEPFDLPRAGG